MTDRLLTVPKVMEIIPLGRTSVTAIVKSLPHVTMGRKLMVYESAVMGWIRSHTMRPDAKPASVAQRPKRRTVMADGLTPDGLIPTRAQLRAMEGGAK